MVYGVIGNPGQHAVRVLTVLDVLVHPVQQPGNGYAITQLQRMAETPAPVPILKPEPVLATDVEVRVMLIHR